MLASPDPAAEADAPHGDPHLRSAREVIGYHPHATDGEIGHLADLLVDEEGWVIDGAVADTGNWRSGAHVVLDLGWINRIDWLETAVYVSSTVRPCGAPRPPRCRPYAAGGGPQLSRGM